MSNLGSSDSPQVKLIHEWGQGFENRDLSLIAKSLHKDYRHITYPRSLGMPEIAREQWLENFARVISLWTAGQEVSYISRYLNPLAVVKSPPQPSMQSVIIADVPGKVVVHVRIPDVQNNTALT